MKRTFDFRGNETKTANGERVDLTGKSFYRTYEPFLGWISKIPNPGSSSFDQDKSNELKCPNHYLIGLNNKVLINGEHVSKLIEEYLPYSIIDLLHLQITFYVTVENYTATIFQILMECVSIIAKHSCSTLKNEYQINVTIKRTYQFV